jgi:hypothetical protein
MTGRRVSRPNRVLVATAVAAAVAATVGFAGTASALGAGPAAAARAPSWHVVKTFSAHDTFLDDVIGLRGGVAWAGGERPGQTPVLYHLTGKTWRAVSLPGSPGTFVTSLSATSAANVWAALADEPLVARLTSKGWVTKSFAHGTDDVATDNIVTIGPKNTWVLAYDFATKSPFAEHFTGSSWARSPLPALVDCDCETHAVSASGPDNIWAWVFDAKLKGFATMRWNGRQWRVIKLPAHLVPAGQHVGALQMLAESPTNVWATADNEMAVGSILLLHWNGRSWGKVGGKLPKGQLAGPIAADGSGGLWLVGRTPTFSQLMLHYGSGRWTKTAMPKDSAGLVTVNALRLIGGTKTVLGVADLSPSPAGDTGAAVIEFGR